MHDGRVREVSGGEVELQSCLFTSSTTQTGSRGESFSSTDCQTGSPVKLREAEVAVQTGSKGPVMDSQGCQTSESLIQMASGLYVQSCPDVEGYSPTRPLIVPGTKRVQHRHVTRIEDRVKRIESEWSDL